MLCEAISVIVTRSALEVTYQGGLDEYARDCPNATYCCDTHLTRVGFMQPDDVQAFVTELCGRTGLKFAEAGRFIDVAVVDQMTGPTLPCDWLDFSRANGITQAWMAGHAAGELVTPPGWVPSDMRLSTWEEAEGLPFSAGSDGLLTTIDPGTGQVRYLGRPPRRPGSGPID